MLVAHRIDDRLRVGGALVHIARHHARERVVGGGFGLRHRGDGLCAERLAVAVKRQLPVPLQHDARHGHRGGEPTVCNARADERDHRGEREPRTQRDHIRHIGQRLHVFGQQTGRAAEQCDECEQGPHGSQNRVPTRCHMMPPCGRLCELTSTAYGRLARQGPPAACHSRYPRPPDRRHPPRE